MVFCDLVGSTALASSMDAEDYTELLRSVFRRLTEVVEGFGGFVGQYLGDGTLNYFGYPTAREDDTARAVTAALAMAAAVSNLAVPGSRRLEARVGISAGDVIMGDIVGAGGARSLDIAGELPSLAARLQAEAKPGTVVVDEAVRRIVEHGFVCRRLGERRFKGWDTEVTVWQVVRPTTSRRQHTGQLSGRHRSHLAPLIGRAVEAAQLAEAWRIACSGTARCLLLAGDAGIGKSRLVADHLQATASDDHARVVCDFSSLQQGMPLAACLPVIERLAGFRTDDAADLRRTKLAKILPTLPETDFELIAGLLGLDAKARAPGAQLSPQKRWERTIAALCSAVIQASHRQPLLVVFEDVHWADPTSAELLRTLVRSIAECPVMLLMTARPETDLTWLIQPNSRTDRVCVIQLEPLDLAKSRSLIGWIKGADSLPAQVVQDIARRCDGVPLYLEEITKAAIETDLAASDLFEPAGLLPRKGGSLPGTIHSSLLARLDRLGPARDLAGIASAIGRDFGLDLLAHVTGEPQERLWPELSRLIEAGLVLACPPDGRHFRFKHALLQDAAYGMITRRQRLPLHARIVDTLETEFPALAAAEPQLLAHHCTEAGLPDRAALWFLRSGIQCLMRSATVEALAQLSRGLMTVEALPRTTERDLAALELRIAYAKALIATQGYAAAETGEAFATARAQCERLGHPPQFLTVLHGQWSHALFRGDIRDARRRANWILSTAEARKDPGWRLIGCYALGITSLPLGDFAQVCAKVRQGLAEFEALGGQAYPGPIVPDPVIIMRTYLSWALMCMGRMDEARQQSISAVGRAGQLGQVFSTAFALWHQAYLTLVTVSVEAGQRLVQELHQLASEHGNSFYEAVTTFYEGWAQAMLGEHEAGLRLMRDGREAHLRTQTGLYQPSYLRMEAEVLILSGRLNEAQDVLNDADSLRDGLGADWDAPEFLRTQGRLLWASGQLGQAEHAFRAAITLATSRSAKHFRLCAALDYAELLVADGRPAAAAAQLSPACAALEGLGTYCTLDTARAMLSTLHHQNVTV